MQSLPISQSRSVARRGAQNRPSVAKPLRMLVVAYAQPTLTQELQRTPRDVLGVEHDAGPTEIKTAFRKLALKYHPDHHGDEERFLEILRAYEILVGKADGKEGRENADWDFHDWYWKFMMLRKQGKAPRQQGPPRVDLTSQLAGLRQRAAVRAAKARAEQTTTATSSEVDWIDDVDSPADSGGMSERLTEDQARRFVEEARRRSRLNSAETKDSITSQLSGLKRKAQLRMEV